MEKLTYRQAFDKITEAYIRGEIKPLNVHFCFCGTLSGGSNWDESGYSTYELVRMEGALLSIFPGIEYIGFRSCRSKVGEFQFVDNYINSLKTTEYEDLLFAGMSAALEVLKEIHRARGEDVDEVPTFTKRELLTPAN